MNSIVRSQIAQRSYLKQHGMMSDLHAKAKDDPIPEDKVDDICSTAYIEKIDDFYATRDELQPSVQSAKLAKKQHLAPGMQSAGKVVMMHGVLMIHGVHGATCAEVRHDISYGKRHALTKCTNMPYMERLALV